MQYQVSWSENKSPDWKIVSVKDLTGAEFADCSVNRVGKKGEIFPNFDEIRAGATIEADFWKSPAGKNYLFAPRPKPVGGYTPRTGNKTAIMDKVMERKENAIAGNIDRKEIGIKISSSMNKAIDLAIAQLGNGAPREEYEACIEKWRSYIWLNWDKKDSDYPPFN